MKKSDQDIIAEAMDDMAPKPEVDPSDPYHANRHLWKMNGTRELQSGSVSNVERAIRHTHEKIKGLESAHQEAIKKKDHETAQKHATDILKHKGVFDGLSQSLGHPLRFGK